MKATTPVFFGYVRPFTNAVYGDFHLVEALAEGKSPLDIDIYVQLKLDAEQLKAYARAVLATFASALKEDEWYQHSYSLYRAFGVIQHACADVYKLDDVPPHPESEDIHGRLRLVVNFINKAIELLDKHGV